jgi:hypothetical protein
VDEAISNISQYGLYDRASNTTKFTDIFLFNNTHKTTLGVYQDCHPMGAGALFPGLGHSPLSRAEVKIISSFTLRPLNAIVVWCYVRGKSPLFYGTLRLITAFIIVRNG